MPKSSRPASHGDVDASSLSNKLEESGAKAVVAEDGRVNIRIDQQHKNLSRIFVPAIHQQEQDALRDHAPPPPYLPPSLGGVGGEPPPPPLNIVMQIVGSRGDVQPFVALGLVLQNTYSHRVRIATHPNFEGFVTESGLEFFSIGGDPAKLMAFMVKNPGLMPCLDSIRSGDVGDRKRDVKDYLEGCWRSCFEPSGTGDDSRPFVADCIIANPPSFAHIHCAEKLGIPLHVMFTMPYSPTQAFPHPLANIQSSDADPRLTKYISYSLVETLTWQGLGNIVNEFRQKSLGLERISLVWGASMLHKLKIPHTYCWSPALIPKPSDWGAHITVSGFSLLNLASNYTPPPELESFMKAGPPPVYIGFGSIVLDDPDAMTELIFEAIRRCGQRVLLSKGWGGVGATQIGIPDNVFMLDNCPHDWLFKQVSCVVHHGGAGTTAAGVSAGRPTLVVPFFGDQHFWGAMIAQAGAGPEPIPHKQLTAEKLAEAISICLQPESQARAQQLASKIASEYGSDSAAQSLHQFLETDKLRCEICPSRTAVWTVKRTRVRLSAFAAYALAEEGLIELSDLKLFRPREYKTDAGPSDPVSGGATAILGTIGTMMSGIAEIPIESAKALKEYSTTVMEKNKAKKSQEQEAGQTMSKATSSSTVSITESENATTSSGQTLSRTASQPKTNDRDKRSEFSVRTGKSIEKVVSAGVESPIAFSMGLAKGFQNAPKLYGDSTVREQKPVTDFASGLKAAGKGLGLGFYDGVTGVVTQPIRGAQKEGTAGFFKGFGKGIGGLVLKPGAGIFGIPAYSMQGLYKEVVKRKSSSVEDYIIASRVAQGSEEWVQSSEAERQDVVAWWKILQDSIERGLA